MDNTLYYGDNLAILRDYIADESVDLIYLDPPFNSNRTYSVLFKDESGMESEAQIAAFEDTWHWSIHTEEVYNELITGSRPEVADMIAALRAFIGANQMMAYLVMMAVRLVELHRVLKPTGSLYLHCDPTASHYLKIVLDTIFEPLNFRNEIVWKRTSAHSDTKQGNVTHMGRIHDIILFYTKTDKATRNEVYTPYSEQYINHFYRHLDADGRRYTTGDLTGPGGAAKGNPQYEFLGVTRYWRYTRENMEELYRQGRIIQSRPGAVPRYKRYLDEMPGVPLQDEWDDIGPVSAQAAERLGYPTQKPAELLKRIVEASSNEGDLVLDPFCGCGTTIAAAQELNRRWIGIDITHLSIALQKYRLKAAFGLVAGEHYQVIGEPRDLDGARQLASDDEYQFQWWALSLIQARPYGATGTSKQGKKGADRGIDGVINFIDDATGKPKRVIVQVKGGKVSAPHIRDLVGTVQREDAAIGVYICMEPPTGPMTTEAATAGLYFSPGWQQDYPKIQILTIEELLRGAKVKMPPLTVTFKQAEKVKEQPKAVQPGLLP